MELLSQNNLIYDPVRKSWVKKTPEEEIRQAWIQRMVQEMDYPLAFLAVEKELNQLPHLLLNPSRLYPKRRIDVVVFAKDIHVKFPLFPLLLVEFKAVPLTPQFAQQALGYNDVVKAPFVAVANDNQVLLGSYDHEAGHFRFKEGLPSYLALKEEINRLTSQKAFE